MRAVLRGCYTACLLLLTMTALADMPGNVPRSDVTVTFKQVQTLGKFVLTVVDYDHVITIPNDTTYLIYASAGAPHGILVYATDGTSYSDSLYFEEYEQKNYTITFTGMENLQLQYTSESTTVAASPDSPGVSAASTDITSRAFWKRNEVLIGVSFAALCVLIVFFVWRKRKKDISNIDSTV